MSRLRAIFITSAIAVLATLPGCGFGYNRTLFVTKTNVGFEASAEPPTFELTIARLEGTVAPQFENGKKLPVMASFRFSNRYPFAPTIGSAFAAGDAAQTMAALYDDPTPGHDWKARVDELNGGKLPTNSALTLEHPPQIAHWLPSWLCWLQKIFPKPEFQKDDVRPVFFGTDTALGLKIAWTGMTGAFPDSAKLGYNRKEVALVPISMEEQTNNTKKTYKMSMSSLLATVDSGVEDLADLDGKPALPYHHLQYFATGNAATLLAMQDDVRKAMLARLDPNKEAFKRLFVSSFSGKIIYDIYRVLKQSDDPEAKALAARLDAFGENYPIPNIKFYTENAQGVVQPDTALKAVLDREKGFYRIRTLQNFLGQSIDTLKRVKAGQAKIPDPANPEGKAPTADERAQYDQIHDSQEEELRKLLNAVTDNQAVSEATRFFQK